MSFLDRPDGLHACVPFDEYAERRLGLVSKGGLEEFERSPLRYKAWVGGEIDLTSEAFEFGQAFHCALLEPDLYATAYATQPVFGDLRTKDAKARRDAWTSENAGKRPVKAEWAEAIRCMINNVRAHPLAGKMVRDGIAELSALWTDPHTGLRCRSRKDWYVEKRAMVLDVKTTRDASYRSFSRDVYNYGYDTQFALYRDGLGVLGVPAKHFVFLACEKDPPYDLALFTLDEAGVSIAYERTRHLMEQLAQCVKEDNWPGYTRHIQVIDAPAWAQRRVQPIDETPWAA